MGKGDIKTRRGKLFAGSYGKKRPGKKTSKTKFADKPQQKRVSRPVAAEKAATSKPEPVKEKEKAVKQETKVAEPKPEETKVAEPKKDEKVKTSEQKKTEKKEDKVEEKKESKKPEGKKEEEKTGKETKSSKKEEVKTDSKKKIPSAESKRESTKDKAGEEKN